MNSGDTHDSDPSNSDNNHTNNESQVITEKLGELFDETIVAKFREEDVTYKEAIQDLLSKEADSPIYTKLGLNYGRAVRFRNEFSKLFSPTTLVTTRKNKPTMGKLESCAPEIKRLYLQKRKRVGTLAKTHWKNSCPKFHTPESKAELLEFAESIQQECAIPNIGFGIDGICDHIRSYFSEQRRYSKFKRSSAESSDSSSNNGDTPTQPRMEMVNAQASQESNEYSLVNHEDSQNLDDSDATMDNETLPLFPSDGEEDSEGLLVPSSQANSLVPKFSYNKTSCGVILKGVLGTMPGRETVVKLLTTKFKVQMSSLSALNHLEVCEVLCRKLVSANYVKIKAGSRETLKSPDINVLKEIDLS